MHPSLSRRSATGALLPALLLLLTTILSHATLYTRTTLASFAFDSSSTTFSLSPRRNPRGVAGADDVPPVATRFHRRGHAPPALLNCRNNAAAVPRGMSTAPVPPDADDEEDANIERIEQLIAMSKDQGATTAQFERMAEGDLTPEVVAEMIETTFVRSCLDLSRGYVDVLKLFIVSVQAAYGMGVALSDLLTMVDRACGERRSANRPLMDEEVELRSTWVAVVYLTLEALGYEPPPPSGGKEQHAEKGDRSAQDDGCEDVADAVTAEAERSVFVRPVADASEQVRLTYSDVIRFVVDEVKRGASPSATTMGVERVMEGCGCCTPVAEDEDPVARAVLSQSVRVVLLTLAVVEEERKCEEDRARGPPAPRPQIPGI